MVREEDLTKDDIQAIYNALGDPYFDKPAKKPAKKNSGTKKAGTGAKKAPVKKPAARTTGKKR